MKRIHDFMVYSPNAIAKLLHWAIVKLSPSWLCLAKFVSGSKIFRQEFQILQVLTKITLEMDINQGREMVYTLSSTHTEFGAQAQLETGEVELQLELCVPLPFCIRKLPPVFSNCQIAVLSLPLVWSWMIIWKQLRMHAHWHFSCVIFFLHEGDVKYLHTQMCL